MNKDSKVLIYDTEETLSCGQLSGRVFCEEKGFYSVMVNGEMILAELTGSLLYGAVSKMDLPVIGDYVAITRFSGDNRGVIHKILSRKNIISRKEPGRTAALQPIAANVDFTFIVADLAGDFSIRRIERYVTLSRSSGVEPVIILAKSDIAAEERYEIESHRIFQDLSVFKVSAVTGDGLDKLKPCLSAGKTIAFLGSSGAGKSTLINALMGKPILPTAELRDNSKGRHTTSRREMLVTPDGVYLMDHPGMRELALSTDEDSVLMGFSEIEELGKKCRFADCSHVSEPGCAVIGAVESGELDKSRYENFLKLEREARYFESRTDSKLQNEQKLKLKQLSKEIKLMKKVRKDLS